MADKVMRSTETYLSSEYRQLLSNAQVLDGINASSRLRAMVKLWARDPKFRSQVDRLARSEPRR